MRCKNNENGCKARTTTAQTEKEKASETKVVKVSKTKKAASNLEIWRLPL